MVDRAPEAAIRTAIGVLSELHHELRGSGPPLLFIAGASADAGHFTRAAQRLADEFTTVTYDRRGCSRSARLPAGERMSIAAQADDAAALLEELALAPAVAFGTSAGGNVLLELLARRPDVLRAAIVHEPALREGMLATGPHFFGAELAAIGAYVPDARQIRSAGVPLRLLVSDAGERPLVRATICLSEQLGLEVASIPGHHAPYLEQPQAFAEQLRPFLRELG
jgi:pimeloyl-ACP methyl ester carboxylesterase